MTREEAVAVLEAFIENPLFSNTHKAAFNIAIHDIKQRHDWDINNLILVNKENYEPVDREIFDKIRAKIEEPLKINEGMHTDSAKAQAIALSWCIEIIDKYRNREGE